MGLNIFENEETSEKEYVEIEDWGFSVHFVLGFQENSIYTLHLCFSYDITSLYKSWLLVSKITWEIWTTSDKQWKVQKVKIWWTFAQKMHSFS